MKSGQNEKCPKLKVVTNGHNKIGQNKNWSKWKVVKMEICQNGKWSKLKVVKIDNGQNYKGVKMEHCDKWSQ